MRERELFELFAARALAQALSDHPIPFGVKPLRLLQTEKPSWNEGRKEA
jgi:hypothetical protein